MMLPDNVHPYRRTDVFTEETTPAALMRAHATKPGVWGRIVVLAGELAYRITDPRRPASELILGPLTAAGIVEPTILHEVDPRGPTRFYVEFLREAAP